VGGRRTRLSDARGEAAVREPLPYVVRLHAVAVERCDRSKLGDERNEFGWLTAGHPVAVRTTATTATTLPDERNDVIQNTGRWTNSGWTEEVGEYSTNFGRPCSIDR